MKLLVSGARTPRISARISCPSAREGSLQQGDDRDEHAHNGNDCSAPEDEHPLDQVGSLNRERRLKLGADLGELGVNLGAELTKFGAHHSQLGADLETVCAELAPEPFPVPVVQLSKIALVV